MSLLNVPLASRRPPDEPVGGLLVSDFGPARVQLSRELVTLGTARKQRGKLAAAAPAMREAVELQPGNFDAHRGLGMVLVGLGRFEEAIVHLERALELRPDRCSTYAHLSRALAGAGRVPEAVESLRTAVAINPDNRDLAEQLTRLTTGS